MDRELFKGGLYSLEINATLGLLDKTKDIENDLLAEYDRLTALNKQLLEAAKEVISWNPDKDAWGWDKLKAAIRAAEEAQ